jgi:hypothetical protein
LLIQLLFIPIAPIARSASNDHPALFPYPIQIQIGVIGTIFLMGAGATAMPETIREIRKTILRSSFTLEESSRNSWTFLHISQGKVFRGWAELNKPVEEPTLLLPKELETTGLTRSPDPISLFPKGFGELPIRVSIITICTIERLVQNMA